MAPKKGFSPFVKQCFVVFGVAVNIIGHGTVIGFTAILFPQLEVPGSGIEITNTSKSWIASIMGFALLIGNAINPFVMEKWGRRSAHLLTTLPITIGWFVVITSRSANLMILGRFLQGVSLGLQGTLSPTLIGEYTSPKNRGAFLTAVSLSLAIGVLFVHTVGTFWHWTYTGLISISFTLVSFIMITFSPETPSWLASKGRYDECREVFIWLRGQDNEEENDELDAMIDARQYEFKLKESNRRNARGPAKTAIGSFLITLRKKEFYKPTFIILHLYVMFQFSGFNVLASYMVDILHAIIGEHADAYFWMIALDVQRLISNMFAVFLIKKVKRRTLLYSTGALCVASFVCISTYSYLKTNGLLTYDAKWIPILLINCYMFSLATGMAPMPFAIAGEVFPVAYRSLGSGISAFFLSGMNFVSVKTAPAMFNSIGIHGTYLVYALIVSYCLVAVWFWLPETKDRTLQEIEEEFRASIVGFALLIGNAITPPLMEKSGRRFAHITTTIPLTVGWVVIATAKNVTALIVGRLLQGISMGMLGPLSSILIGEYASPRNRGVFLTLISLSLATGTLFVHAVGSFLPWQWTAIICSIFTFCSFIVITFSPETPSWLASKGRYDECRENFNWLRGFDNEEEADELEAMIDARQYEFKLKELQRMEPKIEGGFFKRTWIRLITTIRKKEFYKPILVMMHLYIMFQFAGLNVLSAYMVEVLHAVIGEDTVVYVWMISLGVMRLIANVLAVYLMKKLKRRTVLNSAGILCVVSLIGISLYLYQKDHWLVVESKVIPIILIFSYMFSIATGIAPVPFTIAGEIFPVAYRSLGSGISVIFLSSMNFASVKTAPAMFESIGVNGTFIVYAAIVTYCLVVVWFLLPETKDRTLQEIEEEFRGTPLTGQDLRQMQSLQSVKSLAYHESRRCSHPVLY